MDNIHIDIIESKMAVTLRKEPQILFEVLGKGPKGDNIELQKSATHIQWRYAGDVAWTNLVLLSDMEGDPGADGDDGREIELQNSATHIQWRYAGDVAWTNLVSLLDLKGDPGADGDDGREIELQNSATHIQWRYAGDVAWTNLVSLLDLKGDPGADGDDGLAVELQNTGTYIQWRLAGGVWANIISIADLTPDISSKVDKVTGSSLVANTEIAKIHSAGSDAETAGSIINLEIDEIEFSLINSFLK